MNQYDMNVGLRRHIARQNAYYRCERIIMWICAAVCTALIGWKVYQAVAVKIAGIL
jgi:hypothetical protein